MDKRGMNNAFFPRNRRGQELSTNTIIMVILGIIVLVILVLGFTIGWDRFLPFIKSNNVDNIKSSCAFACTTSNTFDFCQTPREVKDGINDPFPSTCYNLTQSEFASRNYGIEECTSITCSQ